MKQYDILFKRVTVVTGWRLDWCEIETGNQKAEATFEIPGAEFNLWVEWTAPNNVKLHYFNADNDHIEGAMSWITPRIVEALAFVGFKVEV